MSRYIDAEELKSAIRKAFPNLMMRVDINSIINAQPTADVVERKHGKWIPIKDDDHWYVLRWECSCCGFWTTSDKMANYCEDCGAKMEDGRGE